MTVLVQHALIKCSPPLSISDSYLSAARAIGIVVTAFRTSRQRIYNFGNIANKTRRIRNNPVILIIFAH